MIAQCDWCETHPRANIGVSGRLHDVCNRLSSRGLCAERLGKPLLIRRLRDDVLDGRSGGSVRPGDLGDDIGIDPLRYDLLKPASIERVLRVLSDGACGGMAGARCSFRYPPCSDLMRPRDDMAMLWMPWVILGSSGDGDGGNGGNSSLSISGLDNGGEAGSGPKNCCDSSISLALSDLWTPDRKPSGRVARAAGTWAIWISPRNNALMLFSICRNGAALVPSLSSSSSSIGGANSRRGVDADSPLKMWAEKKIFKVAKRRLPKKMFK